MNLGNKNIERLTSLRKVPSRQERLRQILHAKTLNPDCSDADTNIQENTEDSENYLLRMETAIIAQTARFCGNVSASNPDKARLESYTVNQWLKDVESRITSKKITAESDQIKEALLLVSTEHGDAHGIITDGALASQTTFKEFKEGCLDLWRPAEHQDKYHNVRAFSVLRFRESAGELISDVERAIKRLTEDIRLTNDITIANRESWNKEPAASCPEDLVSLSAVLKYLSFANMYYALPADYQIAYKKIETHQNLKYTTLVAKLRKEKPDIPRNELTSVTMRQTNPTQDRNGKYNGTNNSSRFTGGKSTSARGRQTSHNPRGRGRGMNPRGNHYDRNWNGTNRYEGSHKSHPQQPRGSYQQGQKHYSSQGARPKMQCQNCGLTNHYTSECRRTKCQNCNKMGHYTGDCWYNNNAHVNNLGNNAQANTATTPPARGTTQNNSAQSS